MTSHFSPTKHFSPKHFSPKSYSNPHHDKFNTTSSSIDQDLEALQKAILEHANDSSEEYTDRLRRLENIIIQKDLNFRTEMKRMSDIKQENFELELELGRKKDEIKKLEQNLVDMEWQWKDEVQALKRQHLEEIAEIKERNTQEALRNSQDLDRASKRVHDQQKKVIEVLENDLRLRDIDIREKDDIIKKRDYEVEQMKLKISDLEADLEPMDEMRKQVRKLTRKLAQLTTANSTEKERNEQFETTIQSLKKDQEEEIHNISRSNEIQLKVVKERHEKELTSLKEELTRVTEKQRELIKKDYEILIEGYESRLKKYSEQEKEIAEIKSHFEEALEREKKLKKMIFEAHMEQEQILKERETKSLGHMKTQMQQLKIDLEDSLRLIKEKDLKIGALQVELKQAKQQIVQLEDGWKRDRASHDLLAKSQELLNHSIENLKPNSSNNINSSGLNATILNTSRENIQNSNLIGSSHLPLGPSTPLNSSNILNSSNLHGMSTIIPTNLTNHYTSGNYSGNTSGISNIDDINRTIDTLRNENTLLRSENHEILNVVRSIQKQLPASPSQTFDASSTAAKMQDTIRKLKKDLRAAEFSSRAKQRLIDLCLSEK